jgi:hypothetical protein
MPVPGPEEEHRGSDFVQARIIEGLDEEDPKAGATKIANTAMTAISAAVARGSSDRGQDGPSHPIRSG